MGRRADLRSWHRHAMPADCQVHKSRKSADLDSVASVHPRQGQRNEQGDSRRGGRQRWGRGDTWWGRVSCTGRRARGVVGVGVDKIKRNVRKRGVTTPAERESERGAGVTESGGGRERNTAPQSAAQRPSLFCTHKKRWRDRYDRQREISVSIRFCQQRGPSKTSTGEQRERTITVRARVRCPPRQ